MATTLTSVALLHTGRLFVSQFSRASTSGLCFHLRSVNIKFVACHSTFNTPFTNIMSKKNDNKLTWKLSPEIIEKSAEELMSRTKDAYDKIGSLKHDSLTYENVIKVKFLDVCSEEKIRTAVDTGPDRVHILQGNGTFRLINFQYYC